MASGSSARPALQFPVRPLDFQNEEFQGVRSAPLLGQGSFGQVHLVRAVSSGRLSAVKVLREGVSEGALSLAEEARRLWTCQGPHVVPFHAAFRTGHAITGIWMALADTSLNVFLGSRDGGLPE